MPHGHHIYAKAYDMVKATMGANSQSDNAFHTVNLYCDVVLNAQ